MILTLYKTNDSSNVINKTLTNPLNFNINLRRDFNVSNPVIKLEVEPFSGISEYNYLHLPELNRYYFIEEVRSINSHLWELRCSCDVLETYKTDILNCSGKFMVPVSSGDYGEIELDTTGRTVETIFESNFEFIESNNSILTVYGENIQYV